MKRRPWFCVAVSALSMVAACSTPRPPTNDAGSDASAPDAASDDAIEPADVATDTGVARPEVRAPIGPVRGTIGNGFQAFLGIPYAEPPVGERRWRSPVAKAPWSDVFDAGRPGNACAQSGLGNALGAEDCLFVNVHTPDPRPTNAPVMVWIHGGAFVFGEGLQTDRGTAGDILAQKYGIVVVSMNYRLGNFGFFTNAAVGANGNQGFEDQQLALRWVRDNISAFGGDPSKVTIVGESAGGLSVCLHLAAPGSQGLFHRAISQSGLCDTPLPTRAAATMGSDAVVRSLGCDTAGDVAACLRAKSMSEVRTAGALGGNVLGSLLADARATWPSVDGAILPGDFHARSLSGDVANVPTVVGWNRDEGTLFVALAELAGTRIDETVYNTVLDALATTNGVPRAMIDAQYPRASFADLRQALAAPLGHSALACPSRRAAKILADRGRTVYTYRFDFPDAAFQLMPDWPLGAFHSGEVQFVFGHPSRIGMPRFNTEQNALHNTMSSYWARFVKTGDPNAADMGPTMPVQWPLRTAMSERSLVIDRTFAVRDELDRAACVLWDR